MLQDWTPVPAATGVIVRPQNLPPWNPPPDVFGQSLSPHTKSGHQPPPPPPPPPSIVSITPNNGPEGGATSAVIVGAAGTNMQELTGVTFGGEDGTLAGGNALQRIVVSPPGQGLVNVVVTGPGGASNPVQYQYNPTDE